MSAPVNTINGKPLGGVLTFINRGYQGICGQTMGADGAGEFALVIMGTPEEAQAYAREHLRKIRAAGYRVSDAIFVPNDDNAGYHGNPVFVVDATI